MLVRTSAIAAATALPLLLLGACGGGDPMTPTPAAAAPAASAAAAPASPASAPASAPPASPAAAPPATPAAPSVPPVVAPLAAGVIRFQSYAVPLAVPGELPALSAAERAEVTAATTTWAAATLTSSFFGNVVTLPPLRHARAEAVAAAASGATLDALRKEVPEPSSPAVAAALMSGIQRTIAAHAESTVRTQFMDDVTARRHPGIWAALSLTAPTAAELAAEPNLRLTVRDVFSYSVEWPAAVAIDGVFEDEQGRRVLAPMVRITGPLRRRADGDTEVVALALSRGRWLVRLTPAGTLSRVGSADLAALLTRTTTWLHGEAGVAAPSGDFVLPRQVSFWSAGDNDVRGMALAQDRVEADLRGLDGQGGTYAELESGESGLRLSATDMGLHGRNSVRFVFSPTNRFAPSGVFTSTGSSEFPLACPPVDLRPAYLALIDELGRTAMLARFTGLGGKPCW